MRLIRVRWATADGFLRTPCENLPREPARLISSSGGVDIFDENSKNLVSATARRIPSAQSAGHTLNVI